MSPKTVKLALSPPLAEVLAEADAMGMSFPALLTADMVRYRHLAQAATPDLSEWEWSLLSHVMDGSEALDILSGHDRLPSGGSIAAAIEEWADHADYDDTARAGLLQRRAVEWPPLTVAGVLMRLRGDRMLRPAPRQASGE